MVKIFIDDTREFPALTEGYQNARTYQECISLLSLYQEIDILHLDYDLGTFETGLDILKYVQENNIKVKEFIIHSTHVHGVALMKKYISENFPESQLEYQPR